MSPAATRRLGVGLIGLGRLGRHYARELAARLPETRLVAIADVDAAAVESANAELGIACATTEPERLLDDDAVEAVVIVSSTHSHAALVAAAADRGRAVFCEKPPALDLAQAVGMKRAAERAGILLQMGFMRRFDPGYAAAHRELASGGVGRPVVFKSTSRDPERPPLEFADPKSSGGLLLDAGIHDFDLARWLVGEVASVHAVGGALVYPELAPLGDVDNAVVSLAFADGRIGSVDVSRSGHYGYDVHTELLCTEGTLRVGSLRETPLQVLRRNAVVHDVVPGFMRRFEAAYAAQLGDFARNVLGRRPPSVTIDDGIAALRIALAARRSLDSGETIEVSAIELPGD